MSKVKMTRSAVVAMAEALVSLKGTPAPAAFSYAASKTHRLLDDELRAINEAMSAASASSPEFDKFNAERIELCEKFAERDENGDLVNRGGSFVISDRVGFDAEFESLKEKHSEAISMFESNQREFSELMESEVEVDVHVVESEKLPDSITSGQVDSLMPMIQESDG